MRSTGLRQFAVSSLVVPGLLLSGPRLPATTHPRYGGTLRVELRAPAVSLDPREWRPGTEQFGAEEKIAALVFDRLLALDGYGRFQPQLATGWAHDASFRRWVFSLRAKVKFSDGTPMTAPDVVSALQPVLPQGLQITALADRIVIQSALPAPDLLEELASGPLFVYRLQQNQAPVGTGPFLAAGVETASVNQGPRGWEGVPGAGAPPLRSTNRPGRLRFVANQEAWSGRPFVDELEVTLGVGALKELLDLELGKTDLADLAPDLVRRAARENLRVWASDPKTLYALRFEEESLPGADFKTSELLNGALDRLAMANVLLQKQAEPASALFPRWLSGYAFLFQAEIDMTRANKVRAPLPASPPAGREPLRLAIEASGDLPKLLAERVAVSARETGLRIQLVGRGPGNLALFAWRYSTLSPRREFENFLSTVLPTELPSEGLPTSDPEALYSREQRVLDQGRLLPLVAVPDYAGIGPRVRDWMPARWGEWHLEQLWLDLAEPGPGETPKNGISTGSAPGGVREPGVKR